jgi:hypothetical protein
VGAATGGKSLLAGIFSVSGAGWLKNWRFPPVSREIPANQTRNIPPRAGRRYTQSENCASPLVRCWAPRGDPLSALSSAQVVTRLRRFYRRRMLRLSTSARRRGILGTCASFFSLHIVRKHVTASLNWVQNIPEGMATLVGSFAGSLIGLLALLVGALYNARLNRKRDDALRRAEAESIAVVLISELSCIRDSLLSNADKLASPKSEAFAVPDLAHLVKLMPPSIEKIGLLDKSAIRETMTAYTLIDQYCERLILVGAKLAPGMPEGRRLLHMDTKYADFVDRYNRQLATNIDKAIAKLEDFLERAS